MMETFLNVPELREPRLHGVNLRLWLNSICGDLCSSGFQARFLFTADLHRYTQMCPAIDGVASGTSTAYDRQIPHAFASCHSSSGSTPALRSARIRSP